MKSKRASKLKRPGQFAGAHGSANTPLKADVENGILTVQIGIETLEWASKPENGGPLEGCKVDGRQRRKWANDVVREMTRENEIGESPLGKFLDSMMEAAENNGSVALCWPNDPSSPTPSEKSSENLSVFDKSEGGNGVRCSAIVRRSLLSLYIQIFLYKCKALAFGWYWKRKYSIVPATPLQIVGWRNNINLWQLVKRLGSGNLRGWLSPELALPHKQVGMCLRLTSDGRYKLS